MSEETFVVGPDLVAHTAPARPGHEHSWHTFTLTGRETWDRCSCGDYRTPTPMGPSSKSQSRDRLSRRCTFHRAHGPVCGRPVEDKSVHVSEDERMRRGAHIWRHDRRDAHRL